MKLHADVANGVLKLNKAFSWTGFVKLDVTYKAFKQTVLFQHLRMLTSRYDA